MSQCDVLCMGTGEGHAHLTITRPRFVQYLARARRRGDRKFTIIGKSRSRRVAVRVLGEAMLTTRAYFRGDVIGDEGPGSYYEPMVLLEMRQ